MSRETRRRVDEIEMLELSDAHLSDPRLSDPKSGRKDRSHRTPSLAPPEEVRPSPSPSTHQVTSTVAPSGFLEATLAHRSRSQFHYLNHARMPQSVVQPIGAPC